MIIWWGFVLILHMRRSYIQSRSYLMVNTLSMYSCRRKVCRSCEPSAPKWTFDWLGTDARDQRTFRQHEQRLQPALGTRLFMYIVASVGVNCNQTRIALWLDVSFQDIEGPSSRSGFMNCIIHDIYFSKFQCHRLLVYFWVQMNTWIPKTRWILIHYRYSHCLFFLQIWLLI